MTAQSDEHERTMAFAEIALGQIKALRQPASPRNYEIWYTYATGYNPSLNQIINEVLAAKGTLADSRRRRTSTPPISRPTASPTASARSTPR